MEQTLETSRQALERLIAAKSQLGLTGTMGDAAIARVREAIKAMEQAQGVFIEGHHEAYAVVKAIDFRHEMGWAHTFQADEDVRAA